MFLQARAEAADERRKELEERSAAELKKKNGLSRIRRKPLVSTSDWRAAVDFLSLHTRQCCYDFFTGLVASRFFLPFQKFELSKLGVSPWNEFQ